MEQVVLLQGPIHDVGLPVDALDTGEEAPLLAAMVELQEGDSLRDKAAKAAIVWVSRS